jgi:tetraacyldisaccharide 4'-kinase
MRRPDFWYRHNFSSRALSTALAPLGSIYGASVAWKSRRRKPYRSHAAVVCVGNLTVGGTGKTPLAIALARMLLSHGVSASFLTRGYGRHTNRALRVDANSHDVDSVGDEALLLARIAPTIVAANRAEGARFAETHGAEAIIEAIIMDDGYQNFTLVKDLSLVVVDGESGFGNGRIVPAGPLREPVLQGLARADAVIVMGEGMPSLESFAGPILRARLACERRLDSQKLIAFAGIGRPDRFFAMLRSLGAKLVETHAFADHHVYSPAEIARLKQSAETMGAGLMTTEKDFVRLKPGDRHGVETLAVHAVFDEPPALAALLDRAIPLR